MKLHDFSLVVITSENMSLSPSQLWLYTGVNFLCSSNPE